MECFQGDARVFSGVRRVVKQSPGTLVGQYMTYMRSLPPYSCVDFEAGADFCRGKEGGVFIEL